ncbi:MAG: alpha-galactosidase [Planctomycetes bacterium]|nr:alpha-galactosidase [Planctomycetota bacterium]
MVLNSLAGNSSTFQKIDDLPLLTPPDLEPPKADWLVKPMSRKASLYRSGRPHEIVLANGLIALTFRLSPNAARSGFKNLSTGESILRAVTPEAKAVIDGEEFAIGGLVGQPDTAYLLPEWLDRMTGDPKTFQFAGFQAGKTEERFPWKRKARSAPLPWPPPGVHLALHFRSPEAKAPGFEATVHYEMYDGLPLLAKRLELRNRGDRPVRLQRFTAEILAAAEYESAVDQRKEWRLPNLHVESDYAFTGMDPTTANHVVRWVPDPEYKTQVNYELKTPALLLCEPPFGPDQEIPPDGRFESFQVFELALDSAERERKGLAMRRMYRALAPWVSENPLMLHLTSSDPKVIRGAIDQAAEAGFEMVIISFWSGFNFEADDPAYAKPYAELAEYAGKKGIELGGYSLFSSRSVGPEVDVINPQTGKPGGAIFGSAPCLATDWGKDYLGRLQKMIERAGFSVLEHDGPYPGDRCASSRHSGHRGLDDSQWSQWRRTVDFYKWCRGRGVHLNVPDWYFLSGSSKTGMGYRENNWSLPREQQMVHARQNMFDGTWEKTPSMGWMLVPLVEYQGGGPAATLEPLSEHLDDYERHLSNFLGFGVQACYRGPRLFDADKTRDLVRKWVQFFKRHRAILESDVIHLRRADGQGWDGILHVNPGIEERGLAFLYNPTAREIATAVALPLYYTGLEEKAAVRLLDGPPATFALNRRYEIELPVKIPARGWTWIEIRDSR